MGSFTTMADLDMACHVSPSSVSGSRYASSPEPKCNKRPREKSLTQLSLEEAWSSLSKQLELFREEARRCQPLDNDLESSEVLSSLDEFSCQQDTTEKLTPDETAQQVLSPCAETKDEQTLVNCLQHTQPQETAVESDTSEESNFSIVHEAYMEESIEQELTISDRAEDEQPVRSTGVFLPQDEELSQRSDKSHKVLVERGRESPNNVSVVNDLDECGERKSKKKRLRSCQKLVCFTKGCVGEKYGTKDGHPERSSQRQLYSSMPFGSAFVRAPFTRKDVKEVEHLFEDSNPYSILRLRRRAGMEPRRDPTLAYVTWNKPNSMSKQ